ncbi:MAG: Type fimbrial biosis protein PilY1, partial [Labilithrix sp.]|nr:Type fimbrial biosis protein PilY1 [Labilithrix sp.]
GGQVSRAGFVVVAAVFAVLPLAAASCASTEDAGDRPKESNPLPESAGDDAAIDAGDVDGGCDASDPRCVDEARSCEEASWCPTTSATSGLYVLTKVWGSSKHDVWAIGSGGTVIHWDGAAWAPTPLPANPLPIKNTFFAIWGSGPNDVWIASTSDTIFRNTGAGWIKQPSPIDRDRAGEATIFAIWGDATGKVRFGARQFLFFEGWNATLSNQLTAESAADGGLAWKAFAGNATVNGYYGNADELWLIGDNSQYTGWQYALTQRGTRSGAGDGGLVFTDVECHSLARLHAIWGSSVDDVWAVGDQGVMRRIRAGQSEWEVVPPVTNENLHAIWGTSASDIWAAGENGTILHYDGTSWAPDIAAFPVGKVKPTLTGIWGSGPDDVWIVGGQTALHYTGKKAGGRK